MSESNENLQTFADLSTAQISSPTVDDVNEEFVQRTLDDIKVIKDWDGQVLFLFGKQQIGKSSILGSLFHFMGSGYSGGQITPMNIIPEGYAFYNKSVQSISNQKLPGRTISNKPISACVEFSPLKKEFPPLRLAILEMSGEDLVKVQTPTGMMGDFREDIKLFLNEDSFNIGFVMVTSHDDAHADDILMADFINYLLNYNNKFPMNRVLLLISKWDTYNGTKQLEEFVKQNMPLTYGALISRKGSLGVFSVGNIVNVNNQPHIARINSDSPKKLLRWIYKHFKGQDIYQLSFWQKLLNKVQ